MAALGYSKCNCLLAITPAELGKVLISLLLVENMLLMFLRLLAKLAVMVS